MTRKACELTDEEIEAIGYEEHRAIATAATRKALQLAALEANHANSVERILAMQPDRKEIPDA
jgi:exopolyphosphatase/pppGpp-phosphohydrolase